MSQTDSVLGCWRITGVLPAQGYTGTGHPEHGYPGVGHPVHGYPDTGQGLENSDLSNPAHQETASLQNVEFTLMECGGVVWNKVINSDLPVVNCTSFQVHEDRVSWNVFRLIRFSSWRGNIIEFVIENFISSEEPRKMDLVLEGWCTLNCTQIRSVEEEIGDFSFNFSVALQENLYPDSLIKLKNREIQVNSFFVPEVIRKKLENIDEEIVNKILFYLYNEALDDTITSTTAERVADFLDEENILKRLSELCRGYAKSVSIRAEFTSIVEDVRLAVNQVLVMFGGRVTSPTGQVESGRNKSAGKLVISQPARLAVTIKQTCKNIVYVFLKIVHFCVRFEEVKFELSPSERSIVANFAKTRIFLLMDQLIELMKAFKYATVDLSSQSRQDLAIYFVEEVEDIAIFFTRLGDEFKSLLESIIEQTAVEREILSSQQDYLSAKSAGNNERQCSEECVVNGGEDVRVEDAEGNDSFEIRGERFKSRTIKTLRVAMLTKEILSLKRVVDQLGYVFSYIKQAKDVFSQQPEQDRIRELARQLEQHVDEIPLLVLTLERTSNRLQDDEVLDDHTFLFEFTSQASSVYTVIHFIKLNKDIFQPLLELIRSNCPQDNIEECLVELGLVNPPVQSDPSHRMTEQQTESTPTSSTNDNHTLSDLSRKFYDSPKSRVSRLAQLGYDLYTSKEGTDMVFELYQDALPPVQLVCHSSSNSNINECDNMISSLNQESSNNYEEAKDLKSNFSDKQNGVAIEKQDGVPIEKQDGVLERIAAHRVVVCARCAWFKRALTSGMKEERERRIVLRDCSPEVFNIFLQFIYSGLYKLDLNTFPVQIIVDLLIIADRYEVPVLVDVCEESLCNRIEEDNTVPLLVIAEQFNTYRLRRKCFEFIAGHPDLLTPEVVDQLPENLKQELIGLHTWVRPTMFSTPVAGTDDGKAGAGISCLQEEEGLLLDSDTESVDPDFNIFS